MTSRATVLLLLSLLAGCGSQLPDPKTAADALLDMRELVVRACTQPPVVDQVVCDRAQAAWNTLATGGQ